MSRCPRCSRGDEIGFCPKCYYEVYVIKDEDIYEEWTHTILANTNHLDKAYNDGYGLRIADAIVGGGRLMPLILDEGKNLLIGYHRLAYAIKHDIEKVPVVMKKIPDISSGMFTEGYSNWLIIGKFNGELAFSVCRFIDVENFISRFYHLKEDFKIEMEVFYKHDG